MGNKKRLLLLALLVIGYSINSYSDTINYKNKENQEHTTSLTVSSETGINATVSGSNLKNSLTIKDSAVITVKGGNGIQITNQSSTAEENNKLTNAGTINVSGGNGINFYWSSTAVGESIFDNEGIISVTGGTGINLRNEKGKIENSGLIKVNNGTGVELINGTMTNTRDGTLKVEGGNGIRINGGAFTNEGIFNASGGTGISINGGEASNTGEMNFSGSGYGINLQKGTFNNKETGIITTESTSGIVINKGAIFINEGTLNNNISGIITINGKFTNSGTFTNVGTIDWTQNITNTGNFTNSNTLDIASNSQTILQQNGTFVNDTTGIINVTGNEIKGITISSTGGNSYNKGIINIQDGGIGVFFNGTNSDTADFTNERQLNVSGAVKNKDAAKQNVVTQSRGIFLNSKGIASNAGNISVTEGALGIQLGNKDASFTNTGTIEVSGSTLVKINEKPDGSGAEKEVLQASTGIQIGSGSTVNKNIIEVKDGARGIYINGGTGTFNNGEAESQTYLAKIKVSGKDSKGIQFGNSGGTATNRNLIQATNEGIGVYFGGNAGNFTNDTNSRINVDQNAKGIYLNAGGTATNKGEIVTFVDEETKKKGAVGVLVNNANATFTNNSGGIVQANGDTKGIQMAAGTVTNNGAINAIGENAVAVYLNGTGTFNNGTSSKTLSELPEVSDEGKDKQIFVSGKGAKGLFYGVEGGTATNKGTITVTNGGYGVWYYIGNEEKFSQGKNSFTNEADGIINVSGEGSVGLQLESAVGKESKHNTEATNGKANTGITENKGTITVTNGGKGVVLGGITFTNSGLIDAGEDGIAIESKANTDNTLILKNSEEQIFSALTRDKKDSSIPSVQSGIKGKVIGNSGVDVLVLDSSLTEIDGLSVSGYEKVMIQQDSSSQDTPEMTISNSFFSLSFNEKTEEYMEENKLNTKAANIVLKNSKIIVDESSISDTTSSPPLFDTGEGGSLGFEGKMQVGVTDAKNGVEYNLTKTLGINSLENIKKSAIWSYSQNENGDIIGVKSSYSDVATNSQIKDFADVLENNKREDGSDFAKGIAILELMETSKEFTDAMTQMSGGVHGYTVDLAAINARTLSGVIKNRELRKDTTKLNPISSYDTDVIYINNKHKIGGLQDVDYEENGIIAVNEKQLVSNGRLGLVVGGTKGEADFEDGRHGNVKMDNLYLGGYYAYDFSDRLTLVSNMNFIYSHDKVKRNVKFADSENGEILNLSYESTYPVFGFGGGATLYYTAYDKDNNKAVIYGGIDWEKIVQGNINEKAEMKEDKNVENLTIKNIPANEQMYDSVVPRIGIALQHNGYIMDRKYRIGADVSYETELGNIKNGKKLKLSALDDTHKVTTTERENIVSYSLNGALDLTENLTVYADYTKAFSDEYDAEKIGAGFEYKMDRMSDVFVVGPLLGGAENIRPHSNRWTGVLSLMLDAEDDTNRSYYNEAGELGSGDYATSVKLKPKMTLSLNDRESNWSYYFETYYMSNGLLVSKENNERRKSESRIHAEARWTDQYSKGKYGINIGYRNETTSSPTLSQYKEADRLERGLHQLRITPNFTYNLGNGFVFGGSTTAIVAYDYRGYRKGQTDFELENEWGITYNGLMPRWRFTMNYFREETWYDGSFTKLSRAKIGENYEQVEVEGDRRYQSNQLRPRVTYFFGNGGKIELSARIPLGNGYWYNSDDGNKKQAEKYETRYGVKYYQPITPGLTGFVGGEILTIKTKDTGNNHGKETRDYSIRPSIGFSYNF